MFLLRLIRQQRGGLWVAAPLALAIVVPSANAQAPSMRSSDIAAFMGTWVFDMTEPPELVGSKETVRIVEEKGLVTATVQVGRFPPNDVTGMLRDGDLLVLTTTMRENGQPIWAIVSLRRTGETMALAQTMEQSRTVKRGTGKRQAN